MSHRLFGSIAAFAVIATSALAVAAPFEDRLVQAPTLAPPQRGSLVGSLSRTSFGPGDIARGTFGLPLPIAVPDDRGPLQAAVVPGYSPEAGLSEWGMGWSVDLSIRRFRIGGEVDFAADEFTSPWGRLIAGDDGYYYPAGVAPMTRLSRTAAGGWLVEAGDGQSYRFEPSDAVTTPAGTYAWQLSRVDNVVGDRTTLTWTRNPSGRPFLTAVTWGGQGDGTAYRMSLAYESVATPWVSIAAGVRHLVDRRVRQVSVGVKVGATYATRWSYTLSYQPSPTGPGFYLTSLQRTMASGQREPAVRYDYDLGVEHRAASSFQPIAALDPVFATYGPATILPSQAAMVDLEQDGRADLELAYDFTALRQGPAGFAVEALPSGDGDVSLCRPSPSPLNTPRFLARMHRDAIDAQVVVTVPMWTATLVMVCDRGGEARSTGVAAGDWDLGANRRLADVDADLRPDLVAVYAGAVYVLPNTSSGPADLSFATAVTTDLRPIVTPDTTWVMDHNGDGRADLVVRAGNDLHVWLGIGGRRFERDATTYPLVLASGAYLPALGNYELSHGDFNGDGLADLIASSSGAATLFTNRGTQYVETEVTALRVLPVGASFPVVADLGASGEDGIVVASNGRAHALDLTTPSTGLLRSADDGMGTVLSFGYGRAAPWPGAGRRHSTLRTLTVTSSGYDPVTYQYEYGAPVWHTVGKFLVGYQHTVKRSPFLTETLSFANDDDVSAVPVAGEDVDERVPDVVRFALTTYDDVHAHNVRWLRPRRNQHGMRTSDGTIAHAVATETLAYARAGCPTITETTGPAGILTETTTLASVATIPDALHCLAASTSVSGRHGDPALDFTYFLDITRNDRGQATSLTQRTPSGVAQLLQEVHYDSRYLVDRTSGPGRGATTVAYDSLGRVVQTTAPSGAVETVTSYDPVTDAVRSLRATAGTASVEHQYRYDGRERLAKVWDDRSGATEADPGASYTYRDPTNLRPGRTDVIERADLAAARRRSVTLTAADGQLLVGGQWMSDALGYTMGAVSIVDRQLGQTRTARVPRMSAGTLSNLTSAQLRVTGTWLSTAVSSGSGAPISSTVTHASGVVGTTSQSRWLTAAGLVTESIHPDGARVREVRDGAGNLTAQTDELGFTSTYGHDALGRLVRVTSPDGDHRIYFDGLGRIATIEREGVATIHHGYDPTTGQPTVTEHRDPSGQLVQSVTRTYEAAGRIATVSQAGGGAAATIAYYYDGDRGPATPPLPGQVGALTKVQGPGWSRVSEHDALGRVAQEVVEIDGWRRVVVDRSYYLGGDVASETRTVYDGGGAVLSATTLVTTLDAAGRVHQVAANGAPLYTLSYDDEGLLAEIGVDATGELIEMTRDEATGARVGYVRYAARGADGVHWRYNPRGQVADETFTRDGVATVRAYGYSPRDQLVRATTGAEVVTYDYAPGGQPTAVTDGAGHRSLVRVGAELSVGDVTYHWDDAGRVDRKGPWTFAYGASGQLERAERPGRVVEYLYDDSGSRIAKKIDGAFARADIADVVITPDHVLDVIEVANITLGVFDNGELRSLQTDPRGTVVVDSAGQQRLASPYGTRAAAPDVAELVDYARLGRDPDLDVVRMGVRDYDPALAQFLTPDPLFLLEPERCLGSPLECNLYGYAGGNPVAYVDPSGMGRRWDWFKRQVKEAALTAVEVVPAIAGGAVGAVAGCAAGGGPFSPGCYSLGPTGAVGGAALGAGFGRNARAALERRKESVRDTLVGTGKAMVAGATSEMGGQIAAHVFTGAIRIAMARLTRTTQVPAATVVADRMKLLPPGHTPKLLPEGQPPPRYLYRNGSRTPKNMTPNLSKAHPDVDGLSTFDSAARAAGGDGAKSGSKVNVQVIDTEKLGKLWTFADGTGHVSICTGCGVPDNIAWGQTRGTEVVHEATTAVIDAIVDTIKVIVP